MDELTLIEASEYRIDEREEEKGKWEGDVEGEVELFTVELCGYDIIRVTGAPVAVLTALRLAILRHWTQGYVYLFLEFVLALIYRHTAYAQQGDISHVANVLFMLCLSCFHLELKRRMQKKEHTSSG